MLLVAVAAAAGCDKNAVQQIAGPLTGGASVKFFNFSVGSPNVNFYVNNVKTTAVASTSCFNLATAADTIKAKCLAAGIEATTGVAYGSAGNGGNAWYSDLPPGQTTVQGRIAAATDKGLAIASAQANIEAGKYYSYYLSGIYNATAKTAESFIIEDPIPPTDYTVAYVRFVHAMAGVNPMRLYLINRTTLAELPIGGTEVAYKAGSAFIAVPVGAYDLATRYAGTATNVVTRTNVSFGLGRVYTITARGNIATASTILLDNTANW